MQCNPSRDVVLAGKHIMTDLFKLTHVWAQHLGFKRMVVETMVIASETITSKAGWTKIATKEYAHSCS